jgi:hypothetical protein
MYFWETKICDPWEKNERKRLEWELMEMNLEMTIFVDKNILWFEVSVNDANSVKITQTIEQLVHEHLERERERGQIPRKFSWKRCS